MKEPTMEEMLKLVRFERWGDGELYVHTVRGDVHHRVEGTVFHGVKDDVFGGVGGDLFGGVGKRLFGHINGREWEYIETTNQKVIRLIQEGRGDEAIKVLEELEQ